MNLIHEIEAEVGKQMELYNYREITDSLEVTKVRFALCYIKSFVLCIWLSFIQYQSYQLLHYGVLALGFSSSWFIRQINFKKRPEAYASF